jgi:hypothetical protein
VIGLLSDLIDYLQAKFPPNRVVVLLTPLFSAASGWLAVLSAEHTPFLNLSQGQLTAVFIAGAGIVVPAVYKWLDGWQAHEARLAAPPYGRDQVAPAPVPREYSASASVGVSQPPPPESPAEAERRRLGYPPAGEGI